jgi:hypothetical protein
VGCPPDAGRVTDAGSPPRASPDLRIESVQPRGIGDQLDGSAPGVPGGAVWRGHACDSRAISTGRQGYRPATADNAGSAANDSQDRGRSSKLLELTADKISKLSELNDRIPLIKEQS